MKQKAFFSLIILVCGILGLQIHKVNAAQSQPPFFIPQKVLNNMHKQEKLPPIESITLDGKPNPVVVEMQQKAHAEALKKQQQAEAEKKRLIEQKQDQEQYVTTERKQQSELNAKQKLESEIKRIKQVDASKKAQQSQANSTSQPEIVALEKTPAADTSPATVPQMTNSANRFAPTKPQIQEIATAGSILEPSTSSFENQSTALQTNDEQDSFDAIISDYRRDATGIGQGKPVNNPRLRDVLKDYTDEQHTL